MRKSILKRVLVCVLSAGMVMSLGGVSALATETEDAAADPVEDAIRDSGTDDSNVEMTATDDGEIKTLATTDGLEAFAVYCADDASLTFYTDETVPEAGSEYKDKTVTTVYTGLETLDLVYGDDSEDLPWYDVHETVTSVVIDSSFAAAQPISLAFWFCDFTNATFSGLENMDTSKVESMFNTFAGCDRLTSVDELAKWDTSSVEDMGWMFSDCEGLESVDVSNWNTANAEYMDGIFYNCVSLTSLDVSGWDTSSATRLDYTFYDCTSLENVDGLANWDTSSVEDMSFMFAECVSLTTVDLSGWNTANVTNMERMFQMYDHSEAGISAALTSVNLSNWNTSNVTNMGEMFDSCANLTSVDGLSGWDTSNVQDMRYMFYDCESLESVDVSKWNTANVEYMYGMFYTCKSLTSMDVSNWKTSNVTDMDYMFYGCESLTDLDVSGWDTSSVLYIYGIFYDCKSLTSVDVSNWDTSNVTEMDYTFCGCESLTSLDASGWDTSSATWMNNMFQGCSSLESLDLSNWDTSSVLNGAEFATGCESLKWIKIGDNFDLFTKSAYALVSQQYWYDSDRNGNVASDNYMIGVSEAGTYYTSTVNAFAVYSADDYSLTFYMDETVPEAGSEYKDKTVTNVYTGLETLDLDEYNNYEAPWYDIREDVTSVVIDESFAGAQPISLAFWFYEFSNASFSGLENMDTSKVESMLGTFTFCAGLTSVDELANWDTASVKDMYGTFYDCTSLESVDGLANWDTSSVEDMCATFYDCTSLESVDGLANWDTSNVTDMSGMFMYCEALASVDGLAAWNTSSVVYLDWMFAECTSLETVDLSEWDTANVTDMECMFEMYYSSEVAGISAALTSVDLSNWKTSNVTGMYSMFFSCESLTDLDVSGWDTSSVETIYDMFYNCKSLTSVDVSNWKTSNVTDMDYTFYGCESLTSLDVSGWDTSSATWMNNMFQGCSSLESLDLSGWDTSKVTESDKYAYFATGCDSLKWIKIGDDFDLFEKSSDALVSQQTWYDSPINGAVVSDNYMIGVSGPGTYYTDTTELTISDVTVTSDLTDNAKVYDGNGVTLTAVVTVDPEDTDLTYQWYKVENGMETPIGSATTENTLTLAGDVSGSGTYKCEVTAIVENVKSDPVSGEITITIEKAKQDISYEQTELEMTVGDEPYTNPLTQTLVDRTGGAEITYTSSNPDFATVDEEGAVTALAAGEVTITAEASATDNYEAAEASYTITIKEPPADKTDLEAAIKEAEDLVESDYTPESWNVLQGALAAAEAVNAAPDALQSEVDAAAKALQDAIAALEVIPPDKSVLEAAVKAAEALNDYKDYYTEDSWNDLQDALSAAKTVADNGDATQSSVNNATVDLVNALADLVPEQQPAEVDKSVLNAMIKAAEALNDYEDSYTPKSWQDMQDALDAAQTVAANDDATQDEVNEAATNLVNALVALVPEWQPGGNTEDGLNRIVSGQLWGYYKDGKVDTSYTGFASNENGDWWVQDGYINFAQNSVYKDTAGVIGDKGTWYYVVGNKVQYDFTGLAHYRNANGWWYIVNGVVDFSHNGVDKNQNGWWYVTGGKVQFGFTGLANYKNENGWWYISGGKVNFNANTVAKNKNGWWYVTGGKVQFGFTGLAHYRNANGWWYIRNGKVDFTYTGRASNQNGTWNVVNGKVRF